MKKMRKIDPEKQLFKMAWGVDRAGYELIEKNIPKGLSLRQGLVDMKYQHFNKLVARSGKYEGYDPLLKIGLIRRFANITIRRGKLDLKDAQNFAKKYGLLGIGGTYGEESENVDEWVDIILRFRDIINQIDQGNKEEAWYIYNGSDLKAPVNFRLSNIKKPLAASFQVVPVTLLGAMYIMLASEIVKGAQSQQCSKGGCLEWFPIRSNQHYCSNACRQAAYRENLEVNG